MAGKMRVIAKLFLGTGVLAAGGSAYYGTMHGWHLPEIRVGEAAPLASAADLDAVASAWAEAEPARPLATMDSSPVARSANVAAVASASEPEPAVAAVDRYAVPPTVAMEPVKVDGDVVPASVETEVEGEGVPPEGSSKTSLDAGQTPVVANIESATGSESNEEGSPEPTIAPEVLAESADEASNLTKVDASALDKSDVPLARGQEPKEEASAPGGAGTNLGGAIDALASDSSPLPEPRALAPLSEPVNMATTSRVAQQAFDRSNTPPPPVGDRYSPGGGSVPPVPHAVAPNPFAARPSATPTPPVAAASERIQPLSGSPGEAAGTRTAGLEPGRGNGLRPLEGEPVGNPMRSSMPPRSPSSAMLPRDTTPNSYNSRPEPPIQERPSGPAGSSLPGIDGTGKPGEKALEGPQQPTLLIQKFAPSEIQVGKTAKFVLQVRNIGNHAAENVLIQDEVPQGTKLISTSPSATTDGSSLAWQLGKLSPGEDRTVEMQLMPTTEGEIGSVATVSYAAQASVKTKCTMPQLAVRMTAPSEVMVGKQQHVKIEVKNPGSGDATGVVLLENVPQNVKHPAGPALEFEIGTLRAGESRELDLVLTAEKAGKVVNTLTAKADGNLQVQQQVEFEVIAPALAIDVEGPERRYLERPATYEVSVANPGTAAAHNVQIITKLPKGMRFVRANNMGEYDAATHAVYWSLAELPKGERGTVEVVAMPTETGAQTLQVEGHAQQGLSDQKQRQIIVEGLAAIMFEVRDLEDPIEVGGETGYEVRVVNQGTKAATNIQVAIDLPPGLKVISAEGESAHRIQEGRLVFEPLDQLAPKADTVYRFRAQGQQAGDQRINVQVNTDDLEQPIRREESTRVFGDQ